MAAIHTYLQLGPIGEGPSATSPLHFDSATYDVQSTNMAEIITMSQKQRIHSCMLALWEWRLKQSLLPSFCVVCLLWI